MLRMKSLNYFFNVAVNLQSKKKIDTVKFSHLFLLFTFVFFAKLGEEG